MAGPLFQSVRWPCLTPSQGSWWVLYK